MGYPAKRVVFSLKTNGVFNMDEFTVVGQSVTRVDAKDKVEGRVRYTNDMKTPGMLHAKLHTSRHAHARIKSLDLTGALRSEGVRAVLAGNSHPYPVGPLLADRPPLAAFKVRYYGEPIAMVVADTEYEASKAAALIRVEYEPLPVLNSPSEALQSHAPSIHEGPYQPQIVGVYPDLAHNIANHTKIRKGDMRKGWEESDVTVETEVSFGPSDHAALEPRCARAEIMPDGHVVIYSASQAPFYIKKLLHQFFNLDIGKITVHTPMLGGAFGGKGTVQLEFLAYMASRAVGGVMVNLANTREEDLITSPVHIGLEAKVKLGATREGKLRAAEFRFLFDGGAYSDQGAGISKAAAADCTGPYRIDNVWCDSYCVYTNHPYATSFRGFGHPELTFAVERALDMLARKLNMDPLELRLINAIKPGDTTPTGVQLDASNVGDLEACLNRLKSMIGWNGGERTAIGNGKYRVKGISSLWKTSSTPPNAGAGAILTFNKDGSVNLNCAAVELGQGAKTVLAQILAERMKLNMSDIHVTMEVNTQYNPHQWKTVASSTTYLAGRAVIAAADDAIAQLRRTAAIVLKCSPDDLDVAGGRVFLKDSPDFYVRIRDIALGYTYPNGNSVEAQVIGRGSHIVRHLTPLDPDTGFGKPGPQWTVGAQAVEVEYDETYHSYRILQAATVLDAGKVINLQAAVGQMRGGMYMGLSFASSESFVFDTDGIVQNPQFRTYNLLRIGEHPRYLVDFVETPLIDGPYGARGIGEYGVIGMPAALGNSLSAASQTELNQLPLIPERIWRGRKGDEV